jgi:hypothetical protein
MGLTGASLNRFRKKVDAVLDDAFAADLLIGNHSVTGSCPGGKIMTEFVEAGESKNFRFPFRIPAASLLSPLQIGDALEWQISPTHSIALEVIEVSTRPHEERIAITCKKRRV